MQLDGPLTRNARAENSTLTMYCCVVPRSQSTTPLSPCVGRWGLGCCACLALELPGQHVPLS